MCRERDVGSIEGIPIRRERDVGYIEGIPRCRERDVGHIEGFPIRRERDVGHMDAQIRDKARSSPAVGLLRALWTHFASAPFSAPVAVFRGGGSHAAHYQAVTAAQSQGPGGVGSVGYVEVAGHEYGVVMLGGIWFYSSTPPSLGVRNWNVVMLSLLVMRKSPNTMTSIPMRTSMS